MKKPYAYYLLTAIGLIFILEFIPINMNNLFNTTKVSINDVADEETELTIESAIIEETSEILQMSEIILEENADDNVTEDDPEPENINEKINYEEFIPLTNSAMEELIKDCTDRNIPLYIGLGLIDFESDFDSNALSVSDCYGLCQLNQSYFPSGLSDEDNIWYGMAYLEENYIKYEDWTKALNAYNKGHVTGDLVYPTAVFQRAAKWKQILIEHGIDLIIDSIPEVE